MQMPERATRDLSTAAAQSHRRNFSRLSECRMCVPVPHTVKFAVDGITLALGIDKHNGPLVIHLCTGSIDMSMTYLGWPQWFAGA
jgi:hypothetical protein